MAIAVLSIACTGVWAASGQVGAFVMPSTPTPSITPSPEAEGPPAPITGFATANEQEKSKNFFQIVAEFLKSVLAAVGLRAS